MKRSRPCCLLGDRRPPLSCHFYPKRKSATPNWKTSVHWGCGSLFAVKANGLGLEPAKPLPRSEPNAAAPEKQDEHAAQPWSCCFVSVTEKAESKPPEGEHGHEARIGICVGRSHTILPSTDCLVNPHPTMESWPLEPTSHSQKMLASGARA